MAPIDEASPPISDLTAGDIAMGEALTAEAGWNQTEADWRMLLAVGQGFGIRDGGRLVATAFVVPYPPDFGWISMVLVAGTQRRRGLATRLLRHCVDTLTGRGLVPVLDATPAGRAVYAGLGFVDIAPITRWRRAGVAASIRALRRIEPAPVLAADQAAFGADRSAILRDMISRPGAYADRAGDGDFLLSRTGRTATQIGPVVAASDRAALDMIDAAATALAAPLLIDVPDREAALADLLRRHDFRPERPFTRMALGKDAPFGLSANIRALAGPELG